MTLQQTVVVLPSNAKRGNLILGKIIKFVATRCHILSLKCTKFNFGWGSAPDPAGGAYSAPPDPLAGFRGPTSKGKGGRGREERERERGMGSGGRKREVDGQGWTTPQIFSCYGPVQLMQFRAQKLLVTPLCNRRQDGKKGRRTDIRSQYTAQHSENRVLQ